MNPLFIKYGSYDFMMMIGVNDFPGNKYGEAMLLPSTYLGANGEVIIMIIIV